VDLLSGDAKPLIGMIHVQALPGTPRNRMTVDEICVVAAREARVLVEAGFDALLIENMHDVPYLNRRVGPEIVAAMTMVARAVREIAACPLGVQILAGANKEALAVAHAAGAQFIRAEGFVFSHIADEGYMEADAGDLLRFRRALLADGIQIFADVKKKHASHALTSDVTLADTAEAAQFFGADALVITGTATGRPTSPHDLAEAARASDLPLLVGSGVTPGNFRSLAPLADGFIVGSYLKKGGVWSEDLDPNRVADMIDAVRAFRESNAGAPPAQHTEIY